MIENVEFSGWSIFSKKFGISKKIDFSWKIKISKRINFLWKILSFREFFKLEIIFFRQSSWKYNVIGSFKFIFRYHYNEIYLKSLILINCDLKANSLTNESHFFETVKVSSSIRFCSKVNDCLCRFFNLWNFCDTFPWFFFSFKHWYIFNWFLKSKHI